MDIFVALFTLSGIKFYIFIFHKRIYQRIILSRIKVTIYPFFQWFYVIRGTIIIINSSIHISSFTHSTQSISSKMQKCGIMKEFQKIKIQQVQNSASVVEMTKLNFHYNKIHPNISNNFCLMIIQLIVKIRIMLLPSMLITGWLVGDWQSS